MAEGDFTIGTDVAHLLLFHPKDLEHRSEDPIAWYGYDFAYSREARAGNLIAWGTGSDGGYRVRLTTEGLMPAEEAALCPNWNFPYRVRHGRVLLDNTDALPGEAQMSEPEEMESWFTLPNGDYRVVVNPIDRRQDKKLPDYVVVFEPVASLVWVPAAPTPPELRPFKDWEPRPAASMEGEERFAWPQRKVKTEELPLLIVSEEVLAMPFTSTGIKVEPAVGKLAFPEDWNDPAPDYFFIASSDIEGQLGVIGRRSGLSQIPGELPRLSLNGMAVARLETVAAGPVLPLVQVSPLQRPDMDAGAGEAEAFRSLLIAATETGRLDVSSFERERLASLTSAEALTGWALMHMGMPLSQRLALYAASARERIREIGKALG